MLHGVGPLALYMNHTDRHTASTLRTRTALCVKNSQLQSCYRDSVACKCLWTSQMLQQRRSQAHSESTVECVSLIADLRAVAVTECPGGCRLSFTYDCSARCGEQRNTLRALPVAGRPAFNLWRNECIYLFSCRNQQVHNCVDVQLYSFIYYTDMFRSLL